MGNYRLEVNHPWPDNTLWGTFFLVITNLILLFGIAVATRLGEWSTSGALTYLMLVSSAYHACRGGFMCFMEFRDAQVADHLAVNAVLLWLAAKCAAKREWFSPATLRRRPELVQEAVGLLFFLMFLVVQGFILNNPESRWASVFGFCVAVTVVAFAATYTDSPIFYNGWYGWAGVILFGISVVFYALCPHSWYDEAHTIWHVLSMSAIVLLILGCWYGWVVLRQKASLKRKEERQSPVETQQFLYDSPDAKTSTLISVLLDPSLAREED